MAQASPESIRNELLAKLEAAAPEHGIDIVDVEVVGSAKARTVRVRIDHADESADPISLDEVSEQTSWISDLVDEADPLEDSFLLEVSSPGLARPLRRKSDFVRFAGEDVAVKLSATEGRRRYTGRLEGMEDDDVVLSTDEGRVSLPLEDIRSCKIRPRFDDKGAKGGQHRGKRGRR